MPTPKQQRRRALELLEASIDGCTEAIMLAFCVSGDRCGDAVGFSLSTRRQCNGRRQAERDRQKIAAIPASASILPRSWHWLYPMGSILFASHPDGTGSAGLPVAKLATASTTAATAARWRDFIERI